VKYTIPILLVGSWILFTNT